MGEDATAAKVQISVRIDRSDLAELEQIGEEIRPVPVNRNAMIGVAVREYVERHGKRTGKRAD